MGAQDPPILYASRICKADRTPLAADNTDATVRFTNNNIIVVFQLDEEKGPWTSTYSIRWRNESDNPGGAFTELSSSGELKIGSDTDLVNATSLGVGDTLCTAQGAGGSYGDGYEVEGTAISSSLTLADEEWGELHFAVDITGMDFANEDTYTFEL